MPQPSLDPADYRLIVIKDCCADQDPEVQRLPDGQSISP